MNFFDEKNGEDHTKTIEKIIRDRKIECEKRKEEQKLEKFKNNLQKIFDKNLKN